MQLDIKPMPEGVGNHEYFQANKYPTSGVYMASGNLGYYFVAKNTNAVSQVSTLVLQELLAGETKSESSGVTANDLLKAIAICANPSLAVQLLNK